MDWWTLGHLALFIMRLFDAIESHEQPGDSWYRQLRDYCRSIMPQSSNDIRVETSSGGTTFHLVNPQTNIQKSNQPLPFTPFDVPGGIGMRGGNLIIRGTAWPIADNPGPMAVNSSLNVWISVNSATDWIGEIDYGSSLPTNYFFIPIIK